MREHPDDSLVLAGAAQEGLVTRSQVQGLMSRSAWRHRVESGAWVAITPRVARRSGAPETLRQNVLAALLDQGPGAYLSHASAASWWGLPGFTVEPIELMVVRGHKDRSSPLATIHRPLHVPEPFGAVLDGIPVARPALVLLQMAHLVSAEHLRRLLDHLWSRRLLSGPSVRRELAGVMHRGRSGTVAMRELLDSLPANYVPSASGFEGRFVRLLEDAGMPAMRRQVDVGGEQWCGRVDFLDEALPLVVEIDSERYHGAMSSQEDDVLRQRRMERAGFVVLRFTEFEIWHRGRQVVDGVRAARRSLRRAA